MSYKDIVVSISGVSLDGQDVSVNFDRIQKSKAFKNYEMMRRYPDFFIPMSAQEKENYSSSVLEMGKSLAEMVFPGETLDSLSSSNGIILRLTHPKLLGLPWETLNNGRTLFAVSHGLWVVPEFDQIPYRNYQPASLSSGKIHIISDFLFAEESESCEDPSNCPDSHCLPNGVDWLPYLSQAVPENMFSVDLDFSISRFKTSSLRAARVLFLNYFGNENHWILNNAAGYRVAMEFEEIQNVLSRQSSNGMNVLLLNGLGPNGGWANPDFDFLNFAEGLPQFVVVFRGLLDAKNLRIYGLEFLDSLTKGFPTEESHRRGCSALFNRAKHEAMWSFPRLLISQKGPATKDILAKPLFEKMPAKKENPDFMPIDNISFKGSNKTLKRLEKMLTRSEVSQNGLVLNLRSDFLNSPEPYLRVLLQKSSNHGATNDFFIFPSSGNPDTDYEHSKELRRSYVSIATNCLKDAVNNSLGEKNRKFLLIPGSRLNNDAVKGIVQTMGINNCVTYTYRSDLPGTHSLEIDPANPCEYLGNYHFIDREKIQPWLDLAKKPQILFNEELISRYIQNSESFPPALVEHASTDEIYRTLFSEDPQFRQLFRLCLYFYLVGSSLKLSETLNLLGESLAGKTIEAVKLGLLCVNPENTRLHLPLALYCWFDQYGLKDTSTVNQCAEFLVNRLATLLSDKKSENDVFLFPLVRLAYFLTEQPNSAKIAQLVLPLLKDDLVRINNDLRLFLAKCTLVMVLSDTSKTYQGYLEIISSVFRSSGGNISLLSWFLTAAEEDQNWQALAAATMLKACYKVDQAIKVEKSQLAPLRNFLIQSRRYNFYNELWADWMGLQYIHDPENFNAALEELEMDAEAAGPSDFGKSWLIAGLVSMLDGDRIEAGNSFIKADHPKWERSKNSLVEAASLAARAEISISGGQTEQATRYQRESSRIFSYYLMENRSIQNEISIIDSLSLGDFDLQTLEQLESQFKATLENQDNLALRKKLADTLGQMYFKAGNSEKASLYYAESNKIILP